MSDTAPSTIIRAIRAARAERIRFEDAERRAVAAIVRAIEPVEVVVVQPVATSSVR